MANKSNYVLINSENEYNFLMKYLKKDSCDYLYETYENVLEYKTRFHNSLVVCILRIFRDGHCVYGPVNSNVTFNWEDLNDQPILFKEVISLKEFLNHYEEYNVLY